MAMKTGSAQLCNSHGFHHAWPSTSYHHEVFREITKQVEALCEGNCIIVDDTWLQNIVDEDIFVTMYPNVAREDIEHIFFVNLVDPVSTIFDSTIQPTIQRLTTAKNRHSIINKSQFLFWAYYCETEFQWYNDIKKNLSWIGSKLFLSYNRKPAMHRTKLVDAFKAYGLMDSGVVTLGNKNPTKALTLEGNRNIASENIDGDVGIPNDTRSLGNHDIWKSALVNVVSETVIEGDFLSEKIWKPIIGKRPFLLLGPKNSLRKLRGLGFKTFGDFWDESYNDFGSVDTQPGYFEMQSIEGICQILLRLKSYSPAQMLKMYNEMYTILQYNRDHFFNKFAHENMERMHTIIRDEMQ